MQELITTCQESITRMLAQCDAATRGPWRIAFGAMDGDAYAVIGSPHTTLPVCQIEPYGYVAENAHLIPAAVNMHRAALLDYKERLADIEQQRGTPGPRVLQIARVLACADPQVADALRAYEEAPYAD